MVLFFTVRRITVSSSGSSGAGERPRAPVMCLRDSQWKSVNLVHMRVYWVRVTAAEEAPANRNAKQWLEDQPIRSESGVWYQLMSDS